MTGVNPALSEILPGQLYIGRVADAELFPGVVVCVLEERGKDWPASVVHVPIIVPDVDGTVRVDPHQLDKVVGLVEEALLNGQKVAIVCGEGIERSGLAGAYVVHKLRHLSLPDAYVLVREKRAQVQERLEWAHGPRWDTPTYRLW